MRKKQLESEGKLGRFGKILDTTPSEVREELAFMGKEAGESTVTKPTVKTEPGVETLSAVGTATPTLSSTVKTKKVWYHLLVLSYSHAKHTQT